VLRVILRKLNQTSIKVSSYTKFSPNPPNTFAAKANGLTDGRAKLPRLNADGNECCILDSDTVSIGVGKATFVSIYFAIVNIVTERFCKTSLILYHITRRHIQEDSLMYFHEHENMEPNRIGEFQHILMNFVQFGSPVFLQTDRQTDRFGTDGTRDLRTETYYEQEMNNAPWARCFS
jgi:hypothetical protein